MHHQDQTRTTDGAHPAADRHCLIQPSSLTIGVGAG